MKITNHLISPAVWRKRSSLVRRAFTLLVAILVFAPLCACNQGGRVDDKVAAAHSRYDGPAMWKVSDRDSTLYLFGSVHLLPPDVDWRRRDLETAFAEVGTVYFESPDDKKSALMSSILQRRLGVYQDGRTLSKQLDGINQNRLTAAAYNSDVPLARLNQFKPWLASDILSVAAADKAGMRYANSPDAYLRTLAKADDKTIKSLESIETYIEAVSSLPDHVQLRALEKTLKNFDNLVEETKSVNGAWLVGNTDLLETEMLLPAQNSSPDIYRTLFTVRNANWVKVLDGFMKGDTDGMAVVGVGHLLGYDGLPARLKELGYKVERVRRTDLPN